MRRPELTEYFLSMARLAASRGTCRRRAVGCILVNSRNHVLATGMNGPASNMEHCIDNPCPGAGAASGTNLDSCEAIHAEQNALLQCRDVYSIDTCYSTTAPCVVCTKLLLNTSCKKIVFHEDYPVSGKDLWIRAGRVWTRSVSTLTFEVQCIVDECRRTESVDA